MTGPGLGPGTGPLTLEMLAVPNAVPALRVTVRQYLGQPCADVQLCVSELLSNVIRHIGEGTPVSVCVRDVHGGGRTRVEVTDPDPRVWPLLRHAADDEESGRGVALLNAVSLRWGVEQGAASKTVWCEVGGASVHGAGSVGSAGNR